MFNRPSNLGQWYMFILYLIATNSVICSVYLVILKNSDSNSNETIVNRVFNLYLTNSYRVNMKITRYEENVRETALPTTRTTGIYNLHLLRQKDILKVTLTTLIDIIVSEKIIY